MTAATIEFSVPSLASVGTPIGNVTVRVNDDNGTDAKLELLRKAAGTSAVTPIPFALDATTAPATSATVQQPKKVQRVYGLHQWAATGGDALCVRVTLTNNDAKTSSQIMVA